MNQWYNKRMKELKLCLPKAERERVIRQLELYLEQCKLVK